MAAVTASMVKELREMTGAGMMDCKKALAATEGDMDKAVDFLREKGLAAAAKKAGRIAAEGICSVVFDGDTKCAMVEVNSETDFVAKNADFQTYVKEVAEQALVSESADIDAFLAEKWIPEPDSTVAEALSRKIAVIGEKLSIRRFAKMEAANGMVMGYVHGGGRIGVILELETNVVNDAIKDAAKNVCMQIAALKPQYVSRDEISADFLAHERELLLAQVMNDPKEAAKPQKVIDGMIAGRISKEMKEFCLVDQVYVKAEDGKQSVGQYLAEVGKAQGAKMAVKRFVRYETGEGIEKKQENFAEEVAKQMQ